MAVVSAGLNHIFGALYQSKTEKYTFALVPVCVAYLDLVLCLQMKGPFVKQSRTFYQVNVFLKKKKKKQWLHWVEAGISGVQTGILKMEEQCV